MARAHVEISEKVTPPKAVHDSDTLAARAWPQHAAAILCNCADDGRTRLERAASERGTGANLRHANTAAGWSRFADIFGAPSRARNTGESGAAWRVEQIAAVKYWEIIADKLKKAGWSLGWVSSRGFQRASDVDC
jgi:hypothetical protein